MALRPCPECGGKVSDRAISCPHCGVKLNLTAVEMGMAAWAKDVERSERSGCCLFGLLKIVVVLIAWVVILVIIGIAMGILRTKEPVGAGNPPAVPAAKPGKNPTF